MTKILIHALAICFIFASCNSSKQPENQESLKVESETGNNKMYTCPFHKDEKGNRGNKCPDCGEPMTVPIAKSDTNLFHINNETKTTSIKGIVADYLKLKNALVSDDSKGASEAGKSLRSDFKNFSVESLTTKQKNLFIDIAEDAIEHAEHIAANSNNIEHQREHFETLSNDILDLVKEISPGLTLYRDFCPMYKEGKGAFWISEMKTISNPYLGLKMSTCGAIKEEIK
jgi:hypothetical protein